MGHRPLCEPRGGGGRDHSPLPPPCPPSPDCTDGSATKDKDCVLFAGILRDLVEDTYISSAVDLVVAGHMHGYERFWPTAHANATQRDYNSPRAPVYGEAEAEAVVAAAALAAAGLTRPPSLPSSPGALLQSSTAPRGTARATATRAATCHSQSLAATRAPSGTPASQSRARSSPTPSSTRPTARSSTHLPSPSRSRPKRLWLHAASLSHSPGCDLGDWPANCQ